MLVISLFESSVTANKCNIRCPKYLYSVHWLTLFLSIEPSAVLLSSLHNNILDTSTPIIDYILDERSTLGSTSVKRSLLYSLSNTIIQPVKSHDGLRV